MDGRARAVGLREGDRRATTLPRQRVGCGNRTRTGDLRLMRPTSYQLLYPTRCQPKPACKSPLREANRAAQLAVTPATINLDVKLGSECLKRVAVHVVEAHVTVRRSSLCGLLWRRWR